MEYKTYSLKPFDSNMAQRGNLCVATSYGYTGSTINTDTAAYKGAYICTTINPQEFTVLIGGVTCTFDGQGYPKDLASKNYQLFMGSTDIQLEQYGNAIRRAKKITTTRGADGTVETKEVEGESKNIMIASLTPRDNFALQALRAIIPELPDLKNIGDSERDYWCKIAYQWAATMMDNAAQVRADFEDQTEAPTTQEEEVGVLETNTDKLLNNLIVELEKTNEAEIKDEHYVYSERVSIPKLMDFLNNYVKDGNNTVGLKDLIAAISNIQVEVTTDLSDVVDAINNMETSREITGSASIGDAGLGRDAEHPLYISGDGMTLTEVDTRIKAWLNATTIVSDGEGGWKLDVPNNI